MGAVLKFPALAIKARPLPELQKYDADASRSLFLVCQAVIERAKELVEFIDGNRALAKQAGIETIGIELSSILEGGGLERILDGLENAVVKELPSELTLEGLSRLRRTESLLAEANANISKNKTSWRGKFEETVLSGEQPSRANAETPRSNDTILLVSFLTLGALAIVAVVVFASSSKGN